jgi:hypothetical protein
MGVVTHDAFSLRVMFFRVDSGDFGARAVFVREISVAANTKPATAIYLQAQRVLWVIIIGTMTILAADRTVG